MAPAPIALIPDKWQRRQAEHPPKKVKEPPPPTCPDLWVFTSTSCSLLAILWYMKPCGGDRDSTAVAYLDSQALAF